MLTVAGDQVPMIPLVEVAGKAGAVPPLQIAASAVKPGAVGGAELTVTEDELLQIKTVSLTVNV